MPMPWHKPRIRCAPNPDADAVILLHGLWRSVWAMEPMAKYLNQHGYHTINVPYPSFTKPMEEIMQVVHQAVTQHGGKRTIHFVTHSLGGIVTRKLLNELTPQQTGRVVMLAPPNQGSEIVDWLARCSPMKFGLGPAGMQLSSSQINAPSLPEQTDTAIIMGKRSNIPFFRWLLDHDNDGIVSVERGKIDGMNEFHILDTDHTFIATDPRVMKKTVKFLQDGPSNAKPTETTSNET